MSLARSVQVGWIVIILAWLTYGMWERYSNWIRAQAQEDSSGLFSLLTPLLPQEDLIQSIAFLQHTRSFTHSGTVQWSIAAPFSTILWTATGRNEFLSWTLHVQLTSTQSAPDMVYEVATEVESARDAFSGNELVYAIQLHAIWGLIGSGTDRYASLDELILEETPKQIPLIVLWAWYLRHYQQTRFDLPVSLSAYGDIGGYIQAIEELPKRRVVEDAQGAVSFMASWETLFLSWVYTAWDELFLELTDIGRNMQVTVEETHIPGSYDLLVQTYDTQTPLFKGVFHTTTKKRAVTTSLVWTLVRGKTTRKVSVASEISPHPVPTVAIPSLSLPLEALRSSTGSWVE